MKTKTQKKKAGISLIVLVITIIVMIILAAAIILSLNSSGIIGKANEAKAKTEAKQIEEQVKLAAMQTLAEANGKVEDAILKENLSSTFGTTGYGIIGDVTNGWIVTVPATNGQEYKITSTGLVTKITFKHTDTDNDGVLDVGELVTHESGEEFYVIGTEVDTVSLVSKYNLKVENNKVTLVQDKTGGLNPVAFASTDYWWDGDQNGTPKDLNTMPIPEKDENGNDVTCVVADAKSYGAKLGGIGRLITLDEYSVCASIPGMFYQNSDDSLDVNNFWVALYSFGAGEPYMTVGVHDCMSVPLSEISAGVRPAIEISSSMVS